MEIKLWRFDDAPEELRNLSKNGGDEDWLMLIPADHVAGWFERKNDYDEGTIEEPDFKHWSLESVCRSMGVCTVDYYRYSDDSAVVIGSHA